jgi:hypothetical protein
MPIKIYLVLHNKTHTVTIKTVFNIKILKNSWYSYWSIRCICSSFINNPFTFTYDKNKAKIMLKTVLMVTVCVLLWSTRYILIGIICFKCSYNSYIQYFKCRLFTFYDEGYRDVNLHNKYNRIEIGFNECINRDF